MNPLLQSFLSSLFRWVLTGAGAWFVQKGILDETQVTEMIAGAVLALVALAWSLWQKYRSKLELFTVAAMPKGTTLAEAKDSIAAGVSASAGTGSGDVPVLVRGTGDGSVKPRMDAWILPLLLSASLLSGCALGGAVVTPPPPGGPTAEQVQAVRNEAAKLATATKEAATLAVNARRLVQSGFEAGLVSRDALQKVNDASIVVSQKGIAFVNFAETVTTDPSLRVTATELLKIFDDYIVALSGAGQSGAAIRTALAVLRAYLGVQ